MMDAGFKTELLSERKFVTPEKSHTTPVSSRCTVREKKKALPLSVDHGLYVLLKHRLARLPRQSFGNLRSFEPGLVQRCGVGPQRWGKAASGPCTGGGIVVMATNHAQVPAFDGRRCRVTVRGPAFPPLRD